MFPMRYRLGGGLFVFYFFLYRLFIVLLSTKISNSVISCFISCMCFDCTFLVSLGHVSIFIWRFPFLSFVHFRSLFTVGDRLDLVGLDF